MKIANQHVQPVDTWRPVGRHRNSAAFPFESPRKTRRRIVASLSEDRPAGLAADRKLTDRCLDPVNARCRAVQWRKAARSFGNGGPVARQLLLALPGMSVIR